LNHKIHHFNTLQELQEKIDKQIKELDEKIEFQSKIIGDKIREGEKDNAEELSDLKNKLNPEKPKDQSKNKKSKEKKSTPKKKKGKKGESENWIDYQNIHLYNGVGTRGELEVYFKSLEEMKNDSDRLKKTKESLEQLMNSGIKKELAGIGYDQHEGPYELAFIKPDVKREKFSFKSILTVRCE
jgi:hypothetical protein